VREDVQRLQSLRTTIPAFPGLNDYRCILHAHAEDSSHTGGTLAEMLQDAKKASVHAILLTDHYRPPRDFIDGRWRGLKDNVLFIPGSEVSGFLIYPVTSMMSRMDLPTSEFIQTVTAGGGMIFLSHIEERIDHPVSGLTGVEIETVTGTLNRTKLRCLLWPSNLLTPISSLSFKRRFDSILMRSSHFNVATQSSILINGMKEPE
jgi:hypothetical protein